MSHRAARIIFAVLLISFCAWETPAPFIYTPGEGWTYEPVEGEKWTKDRAEDQLQVAKDAFERENYKLSLKAARRTVKVWPLSDYAPEAQYLLGRSYEERGQDEKAFKAYQTLLEKYPKVTNYDEVLQRQFQIATRFLGGQWFKLWGVIPFFPSMDKTAEMYQKIIKNGPYSSVAPKAQMNIGEAREKQEDYRKAVDAYEKAADRYYDRQEVAADAVYRAGLAYQKQAKTAEYDQSVASKAIGTFTDFITLYPQDARVDEARNIIASLKTEQARGSFSIAQFYEKQKEWDGALIYYNEVLLQDPASPWAEEARQRIASIKDESSAPADTARN